MEKITQEQCNSLLAQQLQSAPLTEAEAIIGGIALLFVSIILILISRD